MKKLMSVLLAVCLLAVLAFPAMAAKVDLGTMAQDAINELAKYNSTEVDEAFNTKTMMGYVFGGLCADDTYFLEGDNRFEHYAIPAATLEAKMLASFAGGQTAITEMQTMEIKDFTYEYTRESDQDLKVYQGANYYFNKYCLERTSIGPVVKKSKAGFVVENPYTFTVNGYAKAGVYKYDVYATRNDGTIVKYTIQWAGGDIQFISTASASTVPAGLVAPGAQADLDTTTTTKATTTTTTKKPTTTTTTTKAGTTTTVGGGTTTTTEAVANDTTTEADTVTTTTTQNSAGAVQQTPDEDTTTEEKPSGNNTYVIIGVVLGVVILAVIVAVVIVAVKMKKPASKADADMQSDDVQE